MNVFAANPTEKYMNSYYIQKEAQRIGPISKEVLEQMITGGQVLPTDLYWKKGMGNWEPVSNLGIEGVQAHSLPPTPGNQQAFVRSSPPTVPNYLPWAIVATILCCIPGGIVAIVYSNKANTLAAAGDIASARRSADSARVWLIISVIVGVLASIFLLFIGIVDGASSY